MTDPREERIRALLDLTTRVVDPSDPLGAEVRAGLSETSGLSAQGLELALSEHLETDASEHDLAELLRSVGGAAACHVVLSANVCTGAARAIALGAATAPVVRVRASRRDPTLARVLTRELAASERFRDAGGAITLVEALAPRAHDEVHAYGGEAALRAIEGSLPGGVTFRGHGPGFGVALVGAGAALDVAADRLASDVVPFDQRGCLSPRIALVLGGEERAASFARALSTALGERASMVPRGRLDQATTAELAVFRSLAYAVGALHGDGDHVVAFFTGRAPLPPAARAVTVASCLDDIQAAQLLAPVSRFITIFGCFGLDDAAHRLALRSSPGARRAPLGVMQKPPLDGPVDRRPGGLAAKR